MKYLKRKKKAINIIFKCGRKKDITKEMEDNSLIALAKKEKKNIT